MAAPHLVISLVSDAKNRAADDLVGQRWLLANVPTEQSQQSWGILLCVQVIEVSLWHYGWYCIWDEDEKALGLSSSYLCP